MIPEFIEQWERGYENVYQVVTERADNGPFRRAAASIFYSLINKVSDTPVPRNASDFRLVDRAAYETFNALPERNRMVRALWGWIGFRSIGIERRAATAPRRQLEVQALHHGRLRHPRHPLQLVHAVEDDPVLRYRSVFALVRRPSSAS